MIRWPLIYIACFAVLTACNSGAKQSDKATTAASDTLVYTYKAIKERGADCGTKPDSACSIAEIKYTVFADQKALNDTITARLLDLYGDEKNTYNNLEQQAKGFVKSGADDTARETSMPYSMENSASVLRQNPGLATLQVESYSYSGGAHGSEYIGFINWDTKGNKKISLDDILIEGSKAKLTSIAEKIFRTQEKLNDKSSLADYFFKDAKFALNNNFLITPVGIRFLYNDYEIKAYSEGQTELLIPYVQIKSLLRPNTVVSQYIR